MVVATQNAPKNEQLIEPDESWWESVLADEERFTHLRSRANTESGQPAQTLDKRPPEESEQPAPPDWDYAMGIYKQDQIVALSVSGYNRGGLLVAGERLHGFVPYSHLVEMTCEVEPQRESFLAKFVGKKIRLKVIECVPEEGRIVFSERAARADAGTRTQIFTNLQIGQIVSGEVTNVTDFGVFIDLGGVEGLIHISELSWGRVIHPSHILELGQRTQVQVLDILPERCRIALSLKRLQANPWESASQRFAVNDIVPATITSVVSFGAFARLEEGLEGLVHASEMDLPEGALIRNSFQAGQTIQVRILHIEPANQRLGLSMQLENN
ncbi:MAG: S1 RNA-binding domain-containing protein [Anaerolineales bacterium]|jgi:small subunit ribosomal protein S1|nr:S1 RNA-binding domain-containing protein [Anaerolineales bacterium]